MTRRERIERRLEKRQDWAASRDRKSAAGFARARTIADGIPLGQPILVGHHSEKRHRADIARIDSGMRAGCESQNMAAHHRSVAGNLERALESSIYSDDGDAVEQLEARIAGAEATRERMKAINRAIRKGPGWSERLTPPLTEQERRELERHARFGSHGKPGYPPYHLSNLGGRITADRKRLAEIKTRQARAAEAEASPTGVVLVVLPESPYSFVPRYCRVTFAEKPDREVLTALKAAGFSWGAGSWSGPHAKLPDCVRALVESEPATAVQP